MSSEEAKMIFSNITDILALNTTLLQVRAGTARLGQGPVRLTPCVGPPWSW